MQQIVDLQGDPQFQAMDVAFVSIAFDSIEEQRAGVEQYGIEGVPMASDQDGSVSEAYGVLRWAVGTGEPGHTFVLVDQTGQVVWLRDYGAAQNGGMMYVPPADLVEQIAAAIN